mmetsp:Transcript_5407/g.12942  ORF Transcript_5407/g.12942 Transcript_5407/m.12942 type:complete len:165 (+) Transcript_5407:260-754(+)
MPMKNNVTDIAVVLVLLVATASGFIAPTQRTNMPMSSLSMALDVPPIITETSANTPLVGGASAQLQTGIDVWSASSSSVVLSDESAEDMVARIAAKSAAANDAARAKADKEAAQKAGAKDGSSNLVLGVGAAGVALTLPFFLPNLLRLGSKLSSGGEDDGYGKR